MDMLYTIVLSEKWFILLINQYLWQKKTMLEIRPLNFLQTLDAVLDSGTFCLLSQDV